MGLKIFYFSLISFFIGIFVSSFGFYFFPENLLFFFIFLVILLIFSFIKEKPHSLFLILFLISLFFGAGQYKYFSFEKKNQGDLDHLVAKKILKEAVVIDEPQRKNYQTKLLLKFLDTNSKAIMWVPNYPEYFYWDKLLLEGYLLKPQNFKSKTGKDFDYISYLKKDGIFYEVKPINIKFLKSGEGEKVKEYLFLLKNSFLNQIKKILPKTEASFLGGLILGAKEDMGKELLEDFRKTGVIHIVVLSGFNLTLVADFFMKIFAILGIVGSSILGSVSIVLFTIMTGASATIVRAALMALLVIFAKATGRVSVAIRALFFAGFLMLLWNPMLLVYDPSFQLSFLATLGLLLLSPKIESFIKFIPKGLFDFRGILAATLSTQVFVFPLLLYMMGEISIISPLVNILILILIPFVMFVGLIAVLISYLSLGVSMLIAFIVYLILSYDLFLVNFFAKLPFATWEYNLSFYQTMIIYFVYYLIFLFWKFKFKK